MPLPAASMHGEPVVLLLLLHDIARIVAWIAQVEKHPGLGRRNGERSSSAVA